MGITYGSNSKVYRDYGNTYASLIIFFIFLLALFTTSSVCVANADNFIDIFYTNSFRGAFEWIKKLDWVGLIVQWVISVFSLFGVALVVIRIMTSMLYLSSRSLWEEVHDLKQSNSEGDKYDFGMINMLKSWTKGKAGTGFDALIGAVLILLPDVKKYSDFGEKASGDFDQNMTITQYMLKIALPTVMTVFFFAMGFNGTLFQMLAITVDAMGTAADKAISINYAGYVEDLVNSGVGYKFYFNAQNTNLGDFQQGLAKDLYGRLVSEVRGADAEQLYQLGKNVEAYVATIDYSALSTCSQISQNVKETLAGGGSSGGEESAGSREDNMVPYLGYDIIINGSASAAGEFGGEAHTVDDFFGSTFGEAVPRYESAYTENQTKYIHLFIRQTSSFSGSYFNLDGAAANN